MSQNKALTATYDELPFILRVILQVIGGVMEKECSSLLTEFFSSMRQKQKEEKEKKKREEEI